MASKQSGKEATENTSSALHVLHDFVIIIILLKTTKLPVEFLKVFSNNSFPACWFRRWKGVFLHFHRWRKYALTKIKKIHSVWGCQDENLGAFRQGVWLC